MLPECEKGNTKQITHIYEQSQAAERHGGEGQEGQAQELCDERSQRVDKGIENRKHHIDIDLSN